MGEVHSDTNNLVNRMFKHFKIPGPSTKQMSRNNLEKEKHQHVFTNCKPAFHQSAVKYSAGTEWILNKYFLFLFSMYSFFFFNRSLLEYNCFTILCQFLLYTKVNQPYAYTCPHIPSLLSLPPTLPIPPLQVIAKHRADLPVLCCCFPLAILHLVVYICRCYSHFTPAFPSHLVSSSPFSMSTSLFLSYN